MSANIRLGGLATQLLDVKPRRAMVLHVPRVPDFRESALGVLEIVDVEEIGVQGAVERQVRVCFPDAAHEFVKRRVLQVVDTVAVHGGPHAADLADVVGSRVADPVPAEASVRGALDPETLFCCCCRCSCFQTSATARLHPKTLKPVVLDRRGVGL